MIAARLAGLDRGTNVRYGALGFAALFWGTSTSATKYGLHGFAPALQLLVELVVATSFLWALAALHRTPRGGSLRTYALLALLDPALPFLLIVIGLTSSTAANSSLLGSLESLTCVAFAALVGDERISRSFALGAAIALAGAVLVSSPGSSQFRTGDLFFIASTIPSGLSVIVIRRIAPSTPSLEIARYQTTFAALFIAPCVLIEATLVHGPFTAAPSLGVWASAAYAGVFGLALSNLTFNYALSRVSAGAAGLTLNLIPLLGVASAVAFLGEGLTPAEAIGAALIVLGLAWPALRSRRSHAMASAAEGLSDRALQGSG